MIFTWSVDNSMMFVEAYYDPISVMDWLKLFISFSSCLRANLDLSLRVYNVINFPDWNKVSCQQMQHQETELYWSLPVLLDHLCRSAIPIYLLSMKICFFLFSIKIVCQTNTSGIYLLKSFISLFKYFFIDIKYLLNFFKPRMYFR